METVSRWDLKGLVTFSEHHIVKIVCIYLLWCWSWPPPARHHPSYASWINANTRHACTSVHTQCKHTNTKGSARGSPRMFTMHVDWSTFSPSAHRALAPQRQTSQHVFSFTRSCQCLTYVHRHTQFPMPLWVPYCWIVPPPLSQALL